MKKEQGRPLKKCEKNYHCGCFLSVSQLGQWYTAAKCIVWHCNIELAGDYLVKLLVMVNTGTKEGTGSIGRGHIIYTKHTSKQTVASYVCDSANGHPLERWRHHASQSIPNPQTSKKSLEALLPVCQNVTKMVLLDIKQSQHLWHSDNWSPFARFPVAFKQYLQRDGEIWLSWRNIPPLSATVQIDQ